MSARVVVIGDALIDELRDDRGVREFVGGAALNVAVGLTRLSVPTTLIAMVGDDEAGAHIRTYLADYGVELIASPSAHGSSRAVSTRNATGEPVYEFNAAAQARSITFGEAERAAIDAAALVAVSCFPFDDAAQTGRFAEAVHASSAILAIDPNPRAGMLADREQFVRGFERLASRAALVKVGEDDATLLYDQPLDALRARLLDLGAAAVLATEGSAGATIEAGDTVVTRPISDLPGRIVDTMGAGDAAFAAAIAALVDEAPADEDEWGAILERAMDVAAATCRYEGALLRLPESLSAVDMDAIGT
ncbi:MULTISPECIES: PfkB family carbohydrate kinase [unclassified Microbacterium]|uniref:PfkB family carbohydrate kinase n=1 Tax=unclassified Microbacterium TaxID=2609290 RepID=UPI00214BC468|nr:MULTISPECIES: PfkB family carbohydrate kinase [unclassified Microbacterium]MCR2810800.1 PfkB family carbohydrate kinase [Microbacterium sp. zg.B185]WIM19792.1 PfkB family carbohydrate kinase [Microbacterium sp. zg-B185]